MNDTKHSPGPWEARSGFIICNVHEEPTILCGLPRWHKRHTRINDTPFAGYQNGYYWPSKEQIEANARLIAAAPDLLAALEYLLSQFGRLDHLTDYSAGDKARAAITKATKP